MPCSLPVRVNRVKRVGLGGRSRALGGGGSFRAGGRGRTGYGGPVAHLCLIRRFLFTTRSTLKVCQVLPRRVNMQIRQYANASCRSAHTQRTASCADWCGLLASNTVAPSWRNGIFCVFCACNGVVCPSSMATLTPKVSHADFDAAAAALAHAFASGQQLPLVHLARVLDGVSHNAEQAFIKSGEPANKVL